jgi:hypothetical protein
VKQTIIDVKNEGVTNPSCGYCDKYYSTHSVDLPGTPFGHDVIKGRT